MADMNPHSVDAPYRFTQEELLAIDLEGRCVITDHEAFILFNLYGPAITSEENAAERFAYKMRLYQVIFNCQVTYHCKPAEVSNNSHTVQRSPMVHLRMLCTSRFCCTNFKHGQAHCEAQY